MLLLQLLCSWWDVSVTSTYMLRPAARGLPAAALLLEWCISPLPKVDYYYCSIFYYLCIFSWQVAIYFQKKLFGSDAAHLSLVFVLSPVSDFFVQGFQLKTSSKIENVTPAMIHRSCRETLKFAKILMNEHVRVLFV